MNIVFFRIFCYVSGLFFNFIYFNLPLFFLDDTVELSHALKCTHYDAFRFFHPSAQPLNSVSILTRDFQEENEQPGKYGTLHTRVFFQSFSFSVHDFILSNIFNCAFCFIFFIFINHFLFLLLCFNFPFFPLFLFFFFVGCVHAAMDLFKYAYQLYPFISSELLRDCLILAIKARKIDMRASPYDVSGVKECSGRMWYNLIYHDVIWYN